MVKLQKPKTKSFIIQKHFPIFPRLIIFSLHFLLISIPDIKQIVWSRLFGRHYGLLYGVQCSQECELADKQAGWLTDWLAIHMSVYWCMRCGWEAVLQKRPVQYLSVWTGLINIMYSPIIHSPIVMFMPCKRNRLTTCRLFVVQELFRSTSLLYI